MQPVSVNTQAVSSSFSSIAVSPRTPRGGHRMDDEGDDDVELSLLGESERQQAANGLDPDHGHPTQTLSGEDKRAMVLLCVLCTMFRAVTA
jgi:hypothetical protein